ncbi:DUF4870 domain-containing protein [Aquibacillus halophilus]|uniref:DUF4870 domain-containing protein n=1 Tax=Aquibacillus halophilus TaxID=930132 RepID=A0A6A8DAI6_9BACI|nr:DUF4870 domain-containing protein [Aquibacillus halophilus]MRH42725.1 DUF4870 domain-containing protein [Aquibacillus halophilus]
MVSKDEKLFGMLIYLISFPFPILGPLVIWLIKRETSDFVNYHGKEYWNLFFSYLIYSVVSGILLLIIYLIVGSGLAIFITAAILFSIIGLLLTIFTIVAAVKSYQGEKYRFPLILHLIK